MKRYCDTKKAEYLNKAGNPKKAEKFNDDDNRANNLLVERMEIDKFKHVLVKEDPAGGLDEDVIESITDPMFNMIKDDLILQELTPGMISLGKELLEKNEICNIEFIIDSS